MMGVVVREQPLPAERHHPAQHSGPVVHTCEVVLEADAVDRVDLTQPATLDVQAVDGGQSGAGECLVDNVAE